MTEEEVITKFVEHFNKQRVPSVKMYTEHGSLIHSCRYRLPQEDGTVLKCAAGIFISDTDYLQAMEGQSIWKVKHTFSLPNSEDVVNHTDLLMVLQDAHDTWARGLLNVNRILKKECTYSLSYMFPLLVPVLDTLEV